MKNISIILLCFFFVYVDKCIRWSKRQPTKAEAIEQQIRVNQLNEVYQYTKEREIKQYIKKQIDSINNIKNPYK